MKENEAIKELETSINLAKMCTQNYERKREIQGYEMAINALEELEQYRAIGTPEECRAAVEKQTAKKIKQQQWMYTRCSCGHDFSKHHGDGYYSIPQEQKTKYCPDCGQKLDWSDEDGEID